MGAARNGWDGMVDHDLFLPDFAPVGQEIRSADARGQARRRCANMLEMWGNRASLPAVQIL
jgi:hypothetical protein